MTRLFAFLLIIGSLFLFACSTSKSTTKTEDATSQKVTIRKQGEIKENISLTNYLRRIPGLRVSGDDTNGSVRVLGGGGGVSTSNQPLFVLDGVKVGRSLSRVANLVIVASIADVSVLKPGAEASYYGVDGANGVIVISTKKN